MTDGRAKAHERYHVAMVEVKRRLRAVNRILGAKKSRTLTLDTDNEFSWLQVRKVIELVASREFHRTRRAMPHCAWRPRTTRTTPVTGRSETS